MLTFFGFDLELFVDSGVADGWRAEHGASARPARDFSGQHWLIVHVDADPEHLVWVCAPISVRALQAVATGRATVRDAVRHSLTGAVEVVTVEHGRAVPDRCVCCAAIPEALLPVADGVEAGRGYRDRIVGTRTGP